MGAILVGTSGYSYDDWVGPVYPPGTQPADFLRLYAERFPLTELNFSYYRQPTRSGLLAIADKTPESFSFTVKAHQSLTHKREDDWRTEADRFAEAVSALAESGSAQPESSKEQGSGRLSGVLLQFPYSFHYNQTNRRYLASLTDALNPLRQFVEFRNDEWARETVLREMERRRLGLVIPDLPRLERLPTFAVRATAPFGYVRFHGRNAANWWGGTNVSRYDYRYSIPELNEWIGPIHALAEQTETLIVTFNNHFNGQAVANAEELMGLLGLIA